MEFRLVKQKKGKVGSMQCIALIGAQVVREVC